MQPPKVVVPQILNALPFPQNTSGHCFPILSAHYKITGSTSPDRAVVQNSYTIFFNPKLILILRNFFSTDLVKIWCFYKFYVKKSPFSPFLLIVLRIWRHSDVTWKILMLFLLIWIEWTNPLVRYFTIKKNGWLAKG